MPNYNDIMAELAQLSGRGTPQPSPFDVTRRKYLKSFSDKRGRNVVAYYSGHLQKPRLEGTEICDEDKNAFLNVVHGLTISKGLDLILHTPGGLAETTESVGNYLREMFGTNIEVFVPLMAMSAGTMIACASRKIHMGKQSSIGPIDPQIGRISAGYLLDEFNNKIAVDIKEDSSKALLWRPILEKYRPSLVIQCEQWINLSKEIVHEWLKDGMFSDTDEEDNTAKYVVERLSDYSKMKSHGRQIGITKAKEIGLKVVDLEEDKELEELVMGVHNAFMATFVNTPCFKIVENHKGIATVYSAHSQPTR